MLTLEPPPRSVFCFSAGGSLFSGHEVASKSLRLPPERCVLAKPGPRKSVESLRREIRSGPGSNTMGAPTRMFPLIR
jgi:hypothetical protein